MGILLEIVEKVTLKVQERSEQEGDKTLKELIREELRDETDKIFIDDLIEV